MKIIATSGSRAALTDIVNTYFFTTKYYLDDNGGVVHSINGKLNGFKWDKKGKRYRFLQVVGY